MRLLEFALTAEDDNFAELAGLELLPLASGVFTSFSTSAEVVYISSEDHPQELLPNLEDQFLDEKIAKDTLESLRVVAKKGRVSSVPLNLRTIKNFTVHFCFFVSAMSPLS